MSENDHVIITPIILGCLVRIPKTFRETQFQPAKFNSACENWLNKSAECSKKSGFTLNWNPINRLGTPNFWHCADDFKARHFNSFKWHPRISLFCSNFKLKRSHYPKRVGKLKQKLNFLLYRSRVLSSTFEQNQPQTATEREQKPQYTGSNCGILWSLRSVNKYNRSEDDLRSRIFGTVVAKFLACLPLLGFSNI